MPIAEVLEQLSALNWVDYAILAVIVLAVIGGVGRGFVLGALDLGGLAASLLVAVLGYRRGADWLVEAFEIPSALAMIAAFVGLAIVAQILYWTVVGLFFQLSRPLLGVLGALAPIDRVLGVLPGFVHGVFYATLLLLPFALFPLVPTAAAAIERSAIGSRLVDEVAQTAPEIETLLGREPNGLPLIAPPQTEEGRRIEFGRLGTLAPDETNEMRMFELVNEERARAGLDLLELDDELREVGRAHSQEMFELGYFSHVSPITGSPLDRLRAAGVRFLVAGENLAYAPNVRIAHEGLMNSPGHRANILQPGFGRIGIGVIRSQFRGSMYTQMFRN